MKKMILPSIVISLLLLILTATLVSATAGTWTYRLYALNISGTSDGYSGKMVNYLANGTTWGANILTYIDNPPIKLAIGWNYFSGTEKCGTITIQNVQGGSRYINAQQTANTIYLTKIGCGGIRYGLSNGKHIVSSPGGTNYYDEWTLTEQIP